MRPAIGPMIPTIDSGMGGGANPHGPFGDLVPPNPPAGGTTPPATTPPATTPPATAGGTTPAQPAALSAWDTWYNSPTYQVPYQQGLKAVNTGYAAKGALESGAAMKAISDYGAGQASGALGTYMDDLYRQEALGMSASSALAGVGQNMVGQVSSNNTNAATAAGNAALAAGQASANQWNSIGGAIGTGVGTIAGALGSSYSHPTTANYSTGLPSNNAMAMLNNDPMAGFY